MRKFWTVKMITDAELLIENNNLLRIIATLARLALHSSKDDAELCVRRIMHAFRDTYPDFVKELKSLLPTQVKIMSEHE